MGRFMQPREMNRIGANPASNNIRSWLPIAILASLFGGLCGFLFKLSLLAGVDLFLINFTTSLILSATAFAAVLIRSRSFKFNIGTIAVASGILGGIGQICYFAALSVGPVSIVAVLINLCPAVAILLSIIFLGEKMSRTQFLGVCLAILAGILLVE